MSITKVAEVINNPLYRSHMLERSAETNRFFSSGIMAPISELNVGSEMGLVGIPFWKEFRKRSQILDDTTNISIQNIESGQDIAVTIGRALAPGITDLATSFAGDDPVADLANEMGDAWASDINKTTLAVIKGAMGALAAEGTPVNTLDISALTGGAENLDAESFVDATGVLGDVAGRLTGVAMHSATERSMVKQDLIAYEKDSEGRPSIPTYLGRTVVVDDDLPNPANGNAAGIFDTYLFGPGAIGFGDGSPKVPDETDRQSLTNGGQDVLISRRHMIIHMRGVKWLGASMAKQTPTDAELSNVANYERVYNSRNVRVVRFRHKLAA